MIRLFNHYFSSRLLLLTIVETVVLYKSMQLGTLLRIPVGDPTPTADSAAIFTFVMLSMMTALGMYHTQRETFGRTLQRLLIAFGLASMLTSVVFYVFPFLYVGRGIFAITALLSVAGLLLVRMVFFQLTSASMLRLRVMVIGSGDCAREVVHYLQSPDAKRTMQFVGFYQTQDEINSPDRFRALNHGELLRTVKSMRADEVIIAVRERRGGVLPLRELLECKLAGRRVIDSVAFFEREQGFLKLDHLRASWMIFGTGFHHGLARDIVKRMFDIVFSLTLLLIMSPILLIAALAILIETGRPIVYRQERIGEGGRPFSIMKLRSMIQSAESGVPQWASTGDSRVTRVGRFIRLTRIDELPQLINVLIGNMSFVGPRPERPYFVKQLAEQIPFYEMRHSLKPGITGWSQVRFHYSASVQDSIQKLQYDLYYVKNHSLFLDLLIILETVQVVLLGKGAR